MFRLIEPLLGRYLWTEGVFYPVAAGRVGITDSNVAEAFDVWQIENRLIYEGECVKTGMGWAYDLTPLLGMSLHYYVNDSCDLIYDVLLESSIPAAPYPVLPYYNHWKKHAN